MSRQPAIFRSTVHLLTVAAVLATSGCGCLEGRHRKPHITAYPASPQNQFEAPGIPFYLPKPLLVISKNFYHVEDAKLGLTGTAPIPGEFDSQADYADLNLQGDFSRSGTSESTANGVQAGNDGPGEPTGSIAHSPTLHSTRIPSGPAKDAIPGDGLGPHMFFTYEIVFVPDLTQKYTMEINGGPGEVRAALNLVNGWQFTGLGPYYMKDSSTAQNIMARGAALNLGLGGASDVINSVANLRSAAGAGGGLSAGDVAAVAQAIEEARKEVVFDTKQIPMELWSTKTVYNADGSCELVRVPPRIEDYAEIAVYEAILEAGQMVWRPIAEHQFDREFLGVMEKRVAGSVGTGSHPSGHIPHQKTPSGAPAEGVGVGEAVDGADVPERTLPSPVEPLPSLDAASQTLRGLLKATDPPLGPPPRDPAAAAAAAAMGTDFQQQPDVVYPPPPAAGYPPQVINPEVTKQVLEHTLAPPVQPRRTLWEKLHHRKVHANHEVNGVVVQ